MERKNILYLLIILFLLSGLSIYINILQTQQGQYIHTENTSSYIPPSETETPSNISGEIRIVVLVDNNPFKSGLRNPWGISIYIEYKGLKILFDTGPDPADLKYNADRLGIDLSKVDFIVLSHEHGDHIGGLPLFQEYKSNYKVYIPKHTYNKLSNWIRGLGLTPIPVEDTIEVAPGIYIIGELTPIYEQALALTTSRGIILIVGCSHPGVDNIAEKAVEDLGMKLYIVIGGFHMMGASRERCIEVANKLAELGADKIYPIHCSGNEIRKVIKELYPDKLGEGGVGLELYING